MTEHRDEPLIGELEAALAEYDDLRRTWRKFAEHLEQAREVAGRSGKLVDTEDERQLYRAARGVVDAGYVGDLPEGVKADSYVQVARGYLLAVDKLSEALEGLREHLEAISEQAKP